MHLQKRFGASLRLARKRLSLTQEDFSSVSSRTYLSSLERGLGSPTIEKLEQLASVMDIHPLALLALAYLEPGANNQDVLCAQVLDDLRRITGNRSLGE